MSVDSNFCNDPHIYGDCNKFQIFWVRFQRHATTIGCEDAFKFTVDPNLPATKKTVIDTTTAKGQCQAATSRQNYLAVSLYSMAFTTNELIQLITKTITKDWPSPFDNQRITGYLTSC